jgi:cytochrome c peroxidase
VLYTVAAFAFIYFNFPSMSATDNSVWTSIAKEVKALVDEKGCHPILVRLAWHDAGTYDVSTKTGGPRAAMRHAEGEATHGANAGLDVARKLLQPIKDRYPGVGYADFWQFAGYVAIEAAGGPHMPFRAGRVDAGEADPKVASGRLPDATQGSDHLRWVFNKMGFNDQEIVALSGAHALGRGHKDRSGFEGPWTTTPNKFGNTFFTTLIDNKWVEKPGSKPLQFEDEATHKLMMLPTDLVLLSDASFRSHVDRYYKSQDEFFSDFTQAFVKLSELGCSNLKEVEYTL